jgi:NAD(P)-dependent dehydrogenase (short-subunit alcohol dehydrogenase family)
MKDLDQRVAVVTGAASGIGYALAERFADEGMRVVLADVEDEALARASESLNARGATTLAVRTDVSQARDVEALAEATLARFGAVHVLCNNAGVGGDAAPTWELPLETWRWVLEVNFWGVVHGVRTFVPIMLRQNTEGHIVNTASMAGHLSMPLLSPYHATKFAVVSLTESLHYELALAEAKLRASVLCPGFVRTNIMDSARNRPEHLCAPLPTAEASQALLGAFQSVVAAGIPPSVVAERVVEAIREERFYVFPHPEMLVAVRARMETLIAQRNPVFVFPEEMRLNTKG